MIIANPGQAPLAMRRQVTTVAALQEAKVIADLKAQVNKQAALIDDLQLQMSALRVELSNVNQKATRAANALVAMGKLKP